MRRGRWCLRLARRVVAIGREPACFRYWLISGAVLSWACTSFAHGFEIECRNYIQHYPTLRIPLHVK